MGLASRGQRRFHLRRFGGERRGPAERRGAEPPEIEISQPSGVVVSPKENGRRSVGANRRATTKPSPTRGGPYLVRLMDMKDVKSEAQVVGASVNYSGSMPPSRI